MSSESKQPKVYLLCINPKCPKPEQRCLSGSTLHSHPQQCIHHLFTTEVIIQQDWQKIENYPSDNVGKAIQKKLKIADHHSYITILMKSLKIQLTKIVEQLETQLLSTYPPSQLYDEYEDIYRLDRISYLLKSQTASHHQINKFINAKFIPSRFNSLMLLNQRYDDIQQRTNQLVTKFNQQVAIIANQHCKQERFHVPQESIKSIKYGLIKSKYIGSAKIDCLGGQVRFPRVPNATSFLPWVYTQKSFEEGVHQFKITSGRYPLVSNAGFLVLEQDDIDIYPYLRYKSLFSKDGKNFELVEGTNIEQFIQQTAIVKLRLQLGSNPKCIIFDSQRKSKYVCQLEGGKRYRMGLYGSGWSVIVLELT